MDKLEKLQFTVSMSAPVRRYSAERNESGAYDTWIELRRGDITLVIDAELILTMLAGRALFNESKRATAMRGAICATVANRVTIISPDGLESEQ